MTKRLKLTEQFVKTLARSSPHTRKTLLRSATNAQLKGLCELCLNILHGNLPLDTATFQRFKRNRKVIEDLSNRRIPLYKKRDIINQKGGFLGTLATFAIPLLAQVIASKLQKRK